MSRIGKQPVHLPAGVSFALAKDTVTVKGPKGELKRQIDGRVKIEQEGSNLTFRIPEDADRAMGAVHGLTRALVANMCEGVAKGFERRLEIIGVGYRAEAKSDRLVLSVGYSHPVECMLPKGIQASVEKNTIISLKGIDKEVLGQTAAEIRRVRPPEPYKGKGIRYAGEKVRRKEGKKGA